MQQRIAQEAKSDSDSMKTIADAARRDSLEMKGIAWLTMTFLPMTALAVSMVIQKVRLAANLIVCLQHVLLLYRLLSWLETGVVASVLDLLRHHGTADHFYTGWLECLERMALPDRARTEECTSAAK